MKKIFILFLLSISLFYAKAQASLKNNSVTLSTGWEETIYRNIKAGCVGVQYSRLLAPYFQIEAGATYTKGDGGYTDEGDVIIYKQLSGWSPFSRAQLSLFPQRQKWDVLFGFGSRYFWYKINSTENVSTGTDLIGYTMRQEAQHRIKQLAATFSLKSRYYFHSNWFLELAATHDRFFDKDNIPTLSTTVTWYYDVYFSSTTATAHPQNLWQLTLGVGRRF